MATKKQKAQLTSITPSSACLPELITRTKVPNSLFWPSIALNPAMAGFRCLVSGLIDGSFRSREVFHGGSHSFKIQRTSA